MRRSISVLLALIGLLAYAAQAQPAPEVISFQGRLTDPNGQPVADGAYQLQFRLYDQPTGGTLQWTETQVVTTRKGVFTALLGAVSPLAGLSFEDGYYVALGVNGAAEMEPRTALAAVPYALSAQRLDASALEAGSNVTITPQSDGALRIEAAGGGAGGGLTRVTTDATLAGEGTAASPLRLSDEAVVAGQNVTVTRENDGSFVIDATGGSGGGLSQVATDATLAGDGTTGSPLSLADGSVTGVKLSDTALRAGSDVTITRQGDGSLEIAATGGGGLSLPYVGIVNSNEPALHIENTNGYAGYLGGGTYGVLGQHAGGNAGFLGGLVYGAYGQNINGNAGFLGHDDSGALGFNANGNYGSLGGPAYGTYGQNINGNLGFLGHDDYGVFGRHPFNNIGGLGGHISGAYGKHSLGHEGYLGFIDFGVWGRNNDGTNGSLGGGAGAVGQHYNNNLGFLGSSDYGAYGLHGTAGNYGSLGGSFYGARGWNTNDNRGYLGHDSYGVWGTGTPWAGYFEGNVHVTGTLTGGSAAFKVDHPLDPANQYLAHSIVESPDMKNVYDGTITTDAQGEAVVALPAYFEALNRDFRYQLTVIGTFARAIVGEKIQDNRFVIRTDAPNVEVSWQVTGIRRDPWAEQNRIVVEEAKPTEERGFYLHPALYGQPAERSVAWVRDPEGMRALEEMPARLEAQRRRMQAERQRLDEARQRMQERQRQP